MRRAILRRVVREGHRRDLERPDPERVPRVEGPDIEPPTRPGGGDTGVQEQRGAKGPRERLEVRDVVAVLVRDDDAVDAAREELTTQRAHPCGDHPRAEPGVEEQAAPCRLDDRRVAARSAAQ